MGGIVSSKKKYELKDKESQDPATANKHLKDEIKRRVEEMAERNAALLSADSPKLTREELGNLKNKDRLLEEMRIQPMKLEVATTFSMTIKWELLYMGCEKAIQFFVVQCMPMSDSRRVVTFWSSLEHSPEKKVEIECPSGEWTGLPKQIIDMDKRTIYFGGLTNETPGLVFRVRGKQPAGWGAWSIPNAPFSTLDPILQAPILEPHEACPYRATVSWRPKADWSPFGQVLYYNLYAKLVKDPESDWKAPVGFLASEEWKEVYSGRETETIVGRSNEEVADGILYNDPSKPLAPNGTYAFKLECAVGLSRGDKRYNSFFKSLEASIKMAASVPTQVTSIRSENVSSKSITLIWKPPFDDGGSPIKSYTVIGRRQQQPPEDSGLDSQFEFESKPIEYYCGEEPRCVFGEGGMEGLLDPEAFVLVPGTRYGFNIIATNACGQSVRTALHWVRTLTEDEEREIQEQKLVAEMAQLGADMDDATTEYEGELMASPDGLVNLPEGWTEYWDPHSQEMFYYNEITGQNQWTRPSGSTTSFIVIETEEERKWRTFRKKRFKFLQNLHQRIKGSSTSTDPVRISVRRTHLVDDSLSKLEKVGGGALSRKLQIIYEGESGIDSGGLSKDWFLEFTNKLLHPNYCLFRKGETGVYMIDRRSSLAPDSFNSYRMFGRVLGKALYDQQLVNAPLCTGVIKQMLGLQPDLEDLEEIDPMLCKSLRWMLENDITDILEETFSIMVEEFGTHREVELCERGSKRNVTEKNKEKYVAAVVKYHFTSAVRKQLRSLLEGMWEVVPSPDLQDFAPHELGMLLNGKPGIDVDDIKNGCLKLTGGFDKDSPTIVLFWQVMREFTDEERGKVLRFATGCDKMPLDGFPPFLPFNITKSQYDKGGLPTAHTCFNQLVLPPYEDASNMREKLLMACDCGVGFEMS